MKKNTTTSLEKIRCEKNRWNAHPETIDLSPEKIGISSIWRLIFSLHNCQKLKKKNIMLLIYGKIYP